MEGGQVLVLAPVGRDAELICKVLREAALHCICCCNEADLRQGLQGGAGAVLLAEEALSPGVTEVLKETLRAQPELPLLLAVEEGRTLKGLAAVRGLGADGQVIVLERPLRIPTLLTVVQATLRARSWQEERRRLRLERALEEHSALERQRLGRELHDGLRQQLVGMKMLSADLLKKLQSRSAPEAELMQEFSRLIGEMNDQVRRVINGLAPAKVDAEALLPALERAAANIGVSYGVLCSVNGRVPVTVGDDETATHLFHVAQEAMTNAAKHGRASQIDVCLRAEGKVLMLSVRDDGVGLPDDYDKRGSIGLTSMRYRAELIGATLTLKSGHGEGTTVTCVLSKEH